MNQSVPPPSKDPGHDRTWGFFLRAYKAVVDRVDKELRASSQLSLAEYELLSYLDRVLGRMRFIDLAKVTLLSQSRISRQIDVLQAKGFLVREVSATDRRAIYARLTPGGQAAFNAAAPVFRAVSDRQFWALIAPENLQPFGDSLRALLRDTDYNTRRTEIMEAARVANTLAQGRSVTPPPPLDPQRLIWIFFLRAYKAAVDRVDAAVRGASDLSLAEFELLGILRRSGGRIRFIDLAKVTLLSESRISRQIDALQAKGFICRETTEVDRRATYAKLTPAGADAQEQAREPFRNSYYAEFADLIEAENWAPFSETLLALLQEPGYARRFNTIIEAARAANLGPGASPPQPAMAGG